MTSAQQQFYDSDELAELLRLRDKDGKPDRKAVYWLRYRGEGPPAIRVGMGRRGRLIFRRTDVEAWLASRAEPGAQAS